MTANHDALSIRPVFVATWHCVHRFAGVCDLDAKVRSSSAVSLSNAGISLRNAVARLVLALAPVLQASCPGIKPNFEFYFDNPSDGYYISC